MSLTLDRARQAFVNAMRTGDAREERLHSVVVRLLAIALMVTDRRAPQDQTAILPAPNDYRAWPMVESELGSHCRWRRLRFYVCPKAAILSDDQPFPIGTAFVVETTHIEPMDEPFVSRFVLEKYAGVTTGESEPGKYGAWASATYGSPGEVPPVDKTAFNNRLPLAYDLAGEETFEA